MAPEPIAPDGRPKSDWTLTGVSSFVLPPLCWFMFLVISEKKPPLLGEGVALGAWMLAVGVPPFMELEMLFVKPVRAAVTMGGTTLPDVVLLGLGLLGLRDGATPSS